MEPQFFHYIKLYLQSRVPSFKNSFLDEKVDLVYSNFYLVPLKLLIVPEIIYDLHKIHLFFILPKAFSYNFIARFKCCFQFISFNI